MDLIKKIQNNQDYKNQIDRMSNKSLKMIARDGLKALEAATKGIKQIEPKKANNIEYAQYIANLLQNLASIVLKERSGK